MPGIADEKNKYENDYCKECPKLEAKAAKRGRDPKGAICAKCAQRRDCTDPPIGARVSHKAHGRWVFAVGGGLVSTFHRVTL
jgi:hypothetical protein